MGLATYAISVNGFEKGAFSYLEVLSQTRFVRASNCPNSKVDGVLGSSEAWDLEPLALGKLLVLDFAEDACSTIVCVSNGGPLITHRFGRLGLHWSKLRRPTNTHCSD